MIKKKIAILLVLLGTGLIIYGAGSHILYKKQENELVDFIEESFENDINLNNSQFEIDNNTNQVQSNNKPEVNNSTITQNTSTNTNTNKPSKGDNYVNNKINAIGILEIPSINLKAGIIKGATTKQLKLGVGYYTNTALPSEEEGNFVIAAHDSGRMPIFRNLKSLKIGDEIIINQKNESFRYIVTDKFVVDPYDVEILQSVEGKKEITMFTCTNKGKQRLVVKGEAI